MGRFTCLLLLLAGLLFGDEAPPAASSGESSLKSMSLEQLLATPVSSVRRREESLGRAAGAVYVINQEDLRRSGATTIAEALRLVPGLQVARIGVQSWAISARGFDWVYSNKLLVMIDGRTVYNPVFGGVFWDSQDTLLEDIERIEVMRGPGAAMWGANAVNGVINIITKPARRTQGGLATVGGGTQTRALGRFRYGGPAGARGFFRVYGQERVEVTAASVDPEAGQSRWSMTQGGFRGDWDVNDCDSVTAQGGVFRSGARSLAFVASGQRPEGLEIPDQPEAWGGNFLVRWEHAHRDGSSSTLQTYYDGYRRESLFPEIAVHTWDVDYHYRRALGGRQELSFGSGVRLIADRTPSTGYLTFDPDRAQYRLVQFTLQDDIDLMRDRLALSAAVRLERNSFTGWSTQPTLRFLWTPSPNQTVWAAVSHAVRTPTRADLGVRDTLANTSEVGPLRLFAVLGGNPRLANELSYTAELGHRYRWRRRLTWDVAAHASRYSRLLESVADAAGLRLGQRDGAWGLVFPVTNANTLAAHSHGVEVVGRYEAARTWRLTGSWTWLRMTAWSKAEGIKMLGPLGTVGNYPEHQVMVRSEWKPGRRWELDIAYSRMGDLLSSATTVFAHHRGEARLGWMLNESTELSAGVDNLLHCACREFASVPGPAVIKIRPSAYVQLGFRY